MRPWDSVAGTRWTRCTPPSYFSRAQTPWPVGAPCLADLDGDGHGLDAAEPGEVQSRSPSTSPPFGIAQVHPHQVGGEQGGLLPAFTRFDLEDDVLAVVGVLGQQNPTQPVLQFLDPIAPELRRPRRRRRRPRRRTRGQPLASSAAVCSSPDAGVHDRSRAQRKRRPSRVASRDQRARRDRPGHAPAPRAPTPARRAGRAQ